MTQYNTLILKLSNSQLNKLKSGQKKRTEVTLKLSSNVIGNSNKLLTNRHVLTLCKAFLNNSSAGIKLSKTQLSKIA